MKIVSINALLGRTVQNLIEMNRGHVVVVKELPQSLQTVLKKVGYRRKDISVIPQETVSLSSGGGAGRRSFAAIVDVSTGKHEITYGSWGGPNMFVRNAVDSDTAPKKLPRNGAAIVGSEGGGHPVWATIYVHPEMISGMLPTEADVTDRESKILGYFRSYTSSARKEQFSRMGIKPAEIDSLVKRGYVKKNKAGATSITTKGKNAAGKVY
jgi:hypothetical protein